MIGVDETGRTAELDDRRAGKLLADLDVETLQGMLVRMLKAGGVSRARIARVMRCSPATVGRDARAEGIDLGG